MAAAKSDAQRVLSLTTGQQAGREWPLAIVLIGLGAGLLLAGVKGEQLAAAIGVLLLGLSVLIVPHLKWKKLEAVMVELSPEGISFQIQNAARGPFQIPWTEVQGVEQVSFVRWLIRTVAIYWREPCVRISQDYYERHIEVDRDRQGPFWRHHVVPGPDGSSMRIVFHHRTFGIARFRLVAELTARWHAFGRTAGAAQSAAPHDGIDLAQMAIDRIFEKPGVRAILAALASILLPLSIYFWHYGVIAWRDRSISSANVYLADLLKKQPLPALVAGSGMRMIAAAEIARMQPPQCAGEAITRDLGAAPGWTPRYKRVHTCLVDLALASGQSATGVFRIDVGHWLAPIAADTVVTTSYRDSVAPSLAEAEALLCARGHCAVR